MPNTLSAVVGEFHDFTENEKQKQNETEAEKEREKRKTINKCINLEKES